MQNIRFNKNLHKKTILIVEDDEISFLVLYEYLKRYNYNVVRAVNGEVAVSLVQKEKTAYNLVLMDILMPVMNGFEAAEKIKKINKNIPLIAQTAIDIRVNKKFNFSNFDEVLIKPLDFDRLKKLINSTIIKKDISKLLELQIN